MSEGRKDDGGKVRLELLPPELLFATASILTFGANKYSKEFENEWQRLCYAKGVVGVKLTTQKGSVDLVMKNNSKFWTLSMQNGNGKIVGVGNQKTQSELGFWQESELLIQRLEPEINEQNGWEHYENLGYQKVSTHPFVSKAVKYVVPPNTCTLTIATKQGSLEESYAVSATTVLDSLEMMWKVLAEHCSILKPLKIQEGDRNWELGMKWSRVFGALNRHLWSWWGGKGPTSKSFLFGELDEETQHSHLWHAACCIAFLVTYEERKVGEDDRS